MTQLRTDIETLLSPAVAALGLELLGVEFSAGPASALLRLYIDAQGRYVTVEDCEAVSREVSALLDVHDPIDANYTLEVSSPGIDRPLFRPEHFARFVGEQVKVTLDLPQDGRRRFQGAIVGVDGDTITVEQDGAHVALPHGNIQKARLVPDFEKPAKPGKAPRRKPKSGEPGGARGEPTPD
ncbi:ribosome maturation factor RimP [Chiayiivirga flava]|uniref:Ribosome maturation factor RimP n=1 Tax=Chiayiivirga flava TaxID=659595 RepID=A0A7W8FZK5_9GAMM|nr:ribosome maturation factor RimP [Chiayiivirga flava]MBB5206723.1 ribosome maturation factor RimP [Chiayiivirga flava]